MNVLREIVVQNVIILLNVQRFCEIFRVPQGVSLYVSHFPCPTLAESQCPNLQKWGRAEGAGKASCGETVVQKGVFLESPFPRTTPSPLLWRALKKVCEVRTLLD